MRRVVTFFILALLVAGAVGVSSSANGVRVNSSGVSATTFRQELSTIASEPVLQCYLDALSSENYAGAAGNDTIGASAAASWANMRVQGLAISHYVATTFHFTPNATELRSAATSLETEMTTQATQSQLNCPGSAANALAVMPSEMRHDQLRDWADSIYLETKLNSTIPLTQSALQSYFDLHSQDYDTLCVSVALVDPTKVSAFESAASSGESVATLAHQFSLDPHSAQHGGAYGCFSPANSAYASVRHDVTGLSLDHFATTPQYVQTQSGTLALFVAVTKRTPSTFAEAQSAVLSDVRTLNATSASSIEQSIEFRAAVAVDPAFGNWGLSSAGPSVFAPQVPPTSATLGVTALSGSPARYR